MKNEFNPFPILRFTIRFVQIDFDKKLGLSEANTRFVYDNIAYNIGTTNPLVLSNCQSVLVRYSICSRAESASSVRVIIVYWKISASYVWIRTPSIRQRPIAVQVLFVGLRNLIGLLVPSFVFYVILKVFQKQKI